MINVERFYSTFNFRDMVQGDERGRPPKLLQDFFTEDLRYAEHAVNPMSDVLEVGCGFGRLFPPLSRAHSVTGIDFSDLQLFQAREVAKAFPNVQVSKMRAEALTFPDASFDVSLCMNSTLGNMPGIEKDVVAEMIRVTRKRGRIVLRVFADTEEVRRAQHDNYARLGLHAIRDEGDAVVTEEGFYSRRFNEVSLHALFAETGITPLITCDGEAGYLVTASV